MKQPTTIDLDSLAYEAMLERGFLPDFSKAVINEVEALDASSSTFNVNVDVKDLRSWLWFSIDNIDSRDLDQLTFAEELSDGRYKIYVAVANVEHLVKRFTAVDAHASNNTTSVYTPTRTFPMLPERLSTDLTSLNPNQDRLALVFEGVLSNQGSLEEYDVFIANVHNHSKLVYESVSTWLDGQGPIPEDLKANSELEKQVRLQDVISRKLSECRHQQGALTLDTIEPHTVIANGVAIELTETIKGRARNLIENFMIVANTISARFSESHQLPVMRRVVVEPKRWDKIMEIAKEKGSVLPDTPDSVALEHFLAGQKKASLLTFPDLSLTIIKLLGNGEYQVSFPGKEAPGHFGLALRDYSHSTAPNRRFPDLITQRMIVAALTKQKPPYTNQELIRLAAQCTEKEDDAVRVERRMRKSAAAMVLSKSIGKIFSGIVTGMSEKGTWVRIFSPPVDGKLVRRSMNLDVGDRLQVRLVHTDIAAGFIDFETV